jgi:hypothetical protein
MPPSGTRGDENRHPNGADQRLRQTRDQARFSVKKDGSVGGAAWRGSQGPFRYSGSGTSRHEQRTIVGYLEITVIEFNRSIAAVEREITLLREFRTRLVANVVTGKLDVRAAASALPEITESDTIDEPTDGEDLEEAIDDVEIYAVPFGA